jgi:hypothetical protein
MISHPIQHPLVAHPAPTPMGAPNTPLGRSLNAQTMGEKLSGAPPAMAPGAKPMLGTPPPLPGGIPPPGNPMTSPLNPSAPPNPLGVQLPQNPYGDHAPPTQFMSGPQGVYQMPGGVPAAPAMGYGLSNASGMGNMQPMGTANPMMTR